MITLATAGRFECRPDCRPDAASPWQSRPRLSGRFRAMRMVGMRIDGVDVIVGMIVIVAVIMPVMMIVVMVVVVVM